MRTYRVNRSSSPGARAAASEVVKGALTPPQYAAGARLPGAPQGSPKKRTTPRRTDSMATQSPSRRQAAAKRAAATRKRNAANRSAATTKASARRTRSSASRTSRDARRTSQQAARVRRLIGGGGEGGAGGAVASPAPLRLSHRRASRSPRMASPQRGRRLRRWDCSEPGLHRRRRGRGFTYTREDGRPVTDREVLGRLRELAVPPAWQDVWICPDPQGHLQATGIDAAGRKQYLYHPLWREHRDRLKFARMARFGKRLP